MLLLHRLTINGSDSPFNAARPVYTHTVFLKPFKATINVFTAGKFLILKILLIVLLNARYFKERRTLPKLQYFQK
jgi:hypothetical protein